MEEGKQSYSLDGLSISFYFGQKYFIPKTTENIPNFDFRQERITQVNVVIFHTPVSTSFGPVYQQ